MKIHTNNGNLTRLVNVLFALFMIGCSGNAPNLPIHLMVETESESVLSIDNYFDDIRYIPLETSDSCLVGPVKKFIKVKEKFYVQTDNHELMIFSETGRFLWKLSARGRGPGEYLAIEDFDVAEDGRIYLWDWSSRNMLLYSDGGIFQKSLGLEISFINFRLLPDGKIIAYCDRYNSHQIAIVDLSDNSQQLFLPWLPEQRHMKVLISERLSDRNSNNCFTLRENNTVYMIENDSILPVADIDFGNNQKSSSDKMEEGGVIIVNNQVSGLASMSTKMGDISTFLDFPDFAYFSFLMGPVNTHAIWDKMSNEIRYSVLPENTLSVIPFDASTNTPNSILQMGNISTFLHYFTIAEDKDIIRKKFVRDSPDNITKESNPVIIEYLISN